MLILKFYLKRVGLVLALGLMLTACDKDNGTSGSDGNGGSSSYVSDPEGTITVSIRNRSNGGTNVFPDGCGGEYFWIGTDDNFYGGYYGDSYLFATSGQVSGLGDIKKIPTSGWSYQVAVMKGYGYVAKCNNTHVRIYVVDYITAAGSGGVIGATIKYQSPFVP